MDGRPHPAEAGKARTTNIERYRDQRHLTRWSGGGKSHAIEITTDRAGKAGRDRAGPIEKPAPNPANPAKWWDTSNVQYIVSTYLIMK